MTGQSVFRQRDRQQQTHKQTHKAGQLSLPMEQEMAQTLHHEQYLALWVIREPVTQAIQAVRYEIYAITDEHCDTIAAALRELLLAVRTCISVLSGPALSVEMRPYALVMRLAALHRVLTETQVTVRNVRGQCRYGRLASDPTGSYWHLRTSLHDVMRDYQSILCLLKQASSVSLAVAGSITA